MLHFWGKLKKDEKRLQMRSVIDNVGLGDEVLIVHVLLDAGIKGTAEFTI